MEPLKAFAITGPSVTSKPTALSTATALSAKTSPQNWRMTCQCDAPIALSVPISIVLSRTVIKTAKIITSVAVTIATILQEDAMRREQCERTFTDKMSGKRFDRPEFLRMLDLARPGDIIIVWRLDRLGRSLKDLIETVQTLEQRGIELRSLKENIDTTTPTGKLMFHMMAALAEFERDVIRERTLAGLDAACARERTGGRRKATETLRLE
jgi:hypothetical protein